jgi:hypothetical protein
MKINRNTVTILQTNCAIVMSNRNSLICGKFEIVRCSSKIVRSSTEPQPTPDLRQALTNDNRD